MTIEAAYPCVRGSLEPRALTARQIWTIAEQVRRQFLPRYGKPSVDVDRLMLASQTMKVNGIAVAAIGISIARSGTRTDVRCWG